MDDLMEFCIAKGKMSDLLAFLFSRVQFFEKFSSFTPDEVEWLHQKIISSIIEQINNKLFFGGHELILSGGKFSIRGLNETISINVPAIKVVDRTYIIDLSNRAMHDVSEKNYDSAITKSRTLLEEVFCYVIERKNESPSESGDIGKLYGQVKKLYNMHQNQEIDNRINGLLQGLEKILKAISDMRNKDSDAHGVGARRIAIADHHARLFVNSAMTMADFVLSVSDKQCQ